MIISVIGVRAYPSEFRGTSGVEVYVENVVHELKDQVDFRVYTRDTYQKLVKNTSLVKVIPLITVNHKFLEAVVYGLVASIRAARDDSQTVWYQGPGMAMWAWIVKLTGKKVVITVHGFDWERRKWNWLEKIFFEGIVQKVMSSKVTLTSVSELVKQNLFKQFGVASYLTRPGLFDSMELKSESQSNLKRFGLTPKKYLIYMGRVVPEKRIEWIIESFRDISAKPEEFKLVIVGSHGNMPEYMELLRAKYGDARVVWTGYLGAERMSLLRLSTALVMASETEGNPISLMEALSLRVSCIVPEECVSKKFKHLGNVQMFAKGDKNDLRQLMERVIKSGVTKKRYSAREKSFLSEYDWKKTAGIYKYLFMMKELPQGKLVRT